MTISASINPHPPTGPRLRGQAEIEAQRLRLAIVKVGKTAREHTQGCVTKKMSPVGHHEKIIGVKTIPPIGLNKTPTKGTQNWRQSGCQLGNLKMD